MATPQIKREGMIEVGTAEATIARAILVKKGSAENGLAVAGATDRPIGVSINDTSVASGKPVEFATPGDTGWTEFTASAAISAGAEFIAAASGKIAPLPTTGGGTKDALGILHRNSSAGADGDIVIGRLYDAPMTRTIAT